MQTPTIPSIGDFATITDASTERCPEAVAQSIDIELEHRAAEANAMATQTGDQRWNEAALALLGARRFFRPLMADDDRRQA